MMGPTTVAVISALLAPGALALARVNAPADGYAGYTAPSAHVAITSPTDVPTRGRVLGIAVAPASAGADIVLTIDSSVTLKHFTLDNPSRIVVDLGGANLAIRSNYDGKARGPVRNLRLSQYRADTVRLVIDLDGSRSYTVVREGGSVRIALSAPAVAFARWGSSNVGGELSSQVAAGRLEHPAPSAAVVAPVAAPVEAKPVEATPVEVKQVETPIVKAGPQPVVLDDHSGDPLTARTPATVSSMAAARRQQQKPRITVSYDGTNIRDVIAAFATFSGRTIVVGKDVSGDVTADIADKPWDVALQAILQAQGLAATEDASGIITVDSYRNLATNQALEPLVTQIVDINYSKAAVLRGTVQQLLARDCTGLTTMATGRDMGMPMNQGGGGSGGQQDQTAGQGCVVRGSVAADSATNKLIITEVPSRLPEIVARVQQLDVRTPQVAIKAKIIFVNRTGITDIGLAYDLGTGNKQFFQQLVPRIDPNTLTAVDTDGDGVPDATGGGKAYEGPARIALGGRALAGIANANNAIKPNALNLIYSTALGRYQLTAFLNALQTSSLADVQSEPSITILNNRSAEIFVGQEIPIRVIDASSGGGGGGGGQGQPNAAAFFPRATVSKEEAGIKLSVTPQITNNRMVLLNIKAENSSAEIAATDVGVIFNRQRAESQVLVADGEAAVIGGLTVTETNRFRSGIPILMNLPFVGRLFSQNSKNETKRDLLILVTPHILDDGAIPPSR
ncbi:AMIN domain-containing protein [Gemmatimonas sp.]|uniref:type IV pilus secretin family protein n=1 Tax=Gemmatimonas sp. TaxID=1962908 RepID=UPI00286A596C|nr:AMIN domain-containing protein [Gemmatimonas sp.]